MCLTPLPYYLEKLASVGELTAVEHIVGLPKSMPDILKLKSLTNLERLNAGDQVSVLTIL